MRRSLRMYTGMSASALAVIMLCTALFAPKGRAAIENQEGYMLRSWCGKVAVYSVNGTEPVETTGIELKNLPSADQIELEKGIYIENESKLAQILEDLGS